MKTVSVSDKNSLEGIESKYHGSQLRHIVICGLEKGEESRKVSYLYSYLCYICFNIKVRILLSYSQYL